MKKSYLINLAIIVLILALAIVIDVPHSNGFKFLGRDTKTKLGLDLQGGMQVLLEADVADGQTVTTEQLDTARQILENRSNGLGVSEVVFQTAGNNRIIAEFPGMTNTDEVLNTLKGTGLLEFVDTNGEFLQEGTAIKTDKNSTADAASATDTASSTADPAAQTTAASDSAMSDTVVTAEATSDTAAATTAADTAEPTTEAATTESTTAAADTAATAEPTTAATAEANTKIYHTILTGADLKSATVEMNSNVPVVAFEMQSSGAQIFGDFTTNNINKYLAIVLDGKVISCPRINSAITEGKGVIEGNFTVDSANALAVQLKYGALPVALKVVEYKMVGATLGEDSLRKSLIAAAIGTFIAILFMLIYYRVPGIVAVISFIFYGAVTLALYKIIPVTLSLAGIAGFLLSTGGAFDANILQFERVKEEIRNGKSVQQAVGLSWPRAWPSIRDSNIASLITGVILFYFGSSQGATIVKGFAITLMLGVLISLFTAWMVTRTLLFFVTQNIKDEDSKRLIGAGHDENPAE